MTLTVTVLGAGHLGSAFLQGLIKQGHPRSSLIVSNRTPEKTAYLASCMGIRGAKDHHEAVMNADIIVLAVKPSQIQAICKDISDVVRQKRPLVISLAGVVSTGSIESWLGVPELGIVRVMTSILIEHGKGMSALFANPHLTAQQAQVCVLLFNALGKSCWVKQESDLDILTAPIGCAPAYIFFIMEAMQEAALRRGIPKEVAALIMLQLLEGSAELAVHSQRSFGELVASVITPQGVTAESLKPFTKEGAALLVLGIFERAEGRIQQIKSESGAGLTAKL